MASIILLLKNDNDITMYILKTMGKILVVKKRIHLG